MKLSVTLDRTDVLPMFFFLCCHGHMLCTMKPRYLSKSDHEIACQKKVTEEYVQIYVCTTRTVTSMMLDTKHAPQNLELLARRCVKKKMFTYGFDCDFIFPLRILTSYKPRFQFNFFSDYLRAVSYKRDRISHIQQTCPGDGKQSQPGAMSRKYLWCRIGGGAEQFLSVERRGRTFAPTINIARTTKGPRGSFKTCRKNI